MATVDTYEGIKGDAATDVTFHFDLTNDVLYLRKRSAEGQECYGEETPDGYLLFRTDADEFAGLTIVDYWKRFGVGSLEDVSLRGLRTEIETRAQALPMRLAA